jgi:hypothetical protein
MSGEATHKKEQACISQDCTFSSIREREWIDPRSTSIVIMLYLPRLLGTILDILQQIIFYPTKNYCQPCIHRSLEIEEEERQERKFLIENGNYANLT